ncbi:MAG: 1-deoxy-D-xylulose-5-phosphate synthase [Holosporales bacterium]|jgi:1-deoxy-D-xylulose-5-phosphate synthase|nr:1-deoxy-D-xylulose-5-phosphate synthase [Holosporales bacterium]
MILDSITEPHDLKKLSMTKLETLCSELRSEIIRITSKNGGHLGSNLGVIELTVALHHVFDFENDKIIFDVGHQSYAHKLLTGRKEKMEILRSDGGASGFPDPNESKYDHFIAGHASTSISAALGIAHARDLNREDFRVLSILGDGSMSGGMIYEAMNNISNIRNFVIILNDNQMSISESVGKMRRYLSKLLVSRSGLSCRKIFSKCLSCLSPRLSKKIELFIKSIIFSMRDTNIFEEFGLQYIGPIDGHNIRELVSVFENVRDVANYKPVLIHVGTKKGMGYPIAEADITRLHGIDNSKSKKYSNIFGQKITELAEKDEKIVCITAAMKNGCGLAEFAEKFPQRFFDVGIAEEHAVTFAAGLATRGYKAFVCIYSTFLQRSFDQIYHDVVLQDLPVRFIIDKAGFPGKDGKTHSGIYDVAFLQNFPNFTVMAPSSRQELEYMIHWAASQNSIGPIAIRFPKAKAYELQHERAFEMRSRVVSEEDGHVLVISCGDLLQNVIEAAKISGTHPTIIDARVILPFDFETFYEYAKSHRKVIVIEEGIFGGISNVILARLLRDKEHNIISKLRLITASQTPVMHASRSLQLHASGLSPQKLAEALSKSETR